MSLLSRFRVPRPLAVAVWAMLIAGLSQRGLGAQAISTASNALDRINFGDIGNDAYSESAHSFVNLGNPTGTGALGLTYREIAPSATLANVGNPADNEVLTFTMACSSTLQNYLTIQVSGSDTTADVMYLYTASQGYLTSNYYSTNLPEIDFQEADPILPGRFVYETIPIPMSMTGGKTSVTVTLNAAQSNNYYAATGQSTTNLPAGSTARPIYSAFTHTQPYLIVAETDPQGTAPSAAAATPATYNSAYFSSILSSLAKYLSTAASDQAFGSSWTAAVNAGTVPPEIIGYFDTGKSPSNNYTLAQWLNNAAVDTSVGNNVAMERLDMLAYAYITPNFLTSFYQNSTTEQAVVAALDSYSYMQSLNGCYGDMTAWNGLAQKSASFTAQGRTNAQCSPIEGAGTWALGSAIVDLQNDSSFRTALNQPINSTLEPGVLRYQAYQTMLVNHISFLTGSIGHGHAPNQDLLQAKAYVYTNLALRALDAIYGSSLAQSNANMYSYYLNEVAGLATEQYGGIWISNGGLGLEVNGTGNGSYDGGYGWNDAYDLVWLAKILNDNGIETSTSHPVRTVAINAVHAFSNFVFPSLVISGAGYANTMREEETLTFRKNLDVGEINTAAFYYAAVDFSDPYALHGFYLEHSNGITQPMNEAGPWSDLPSVGSGNADDNAVQYLHGYADYLALCNMVNSTPTDPTGITFLNETAHADGVWADPTGSTITIKHAGEKLAMVLNWRPLQAPGADNKPSASAEVVNNLARVHDTTATADRIATVMMPSNAATGASSSYTSGAFKTLYLGRYGNYLVGLNWQTSSVTMTLPPDMMTSGGTATDLVSGINYNLSTTSTVPVPASGAVALYQSLPTATLGSNALNYGPVSAGSSTPLTVSLTNSGSGPLLIGSTSLSGTNSSDFSYTTTCASTLAASSNCSYTITFTPSASGTRAANFSLVTCLSTTAQTISLSGSSSGSTLTVIAGNASRFFDTANPSFTYTMTGFSDGDNQTNSTSGAPSLTTSALRNSTAGNYAIQATAGTLTSSKYYFQFVNGTLTVTGNAPQQIIFPPLAGLAMVSTLRLAAAASSGLPVSYSVSGPATISGSLLTATGTGTVTVTATQAGNLTYAAAPTVVRTLSIQ